MAEQLVLLTQDHKVQGSNPRDRTDVITDGVSLHRIFHYHPFKGMENAVSLIKVCTFQTPAARTDIYKGSFFPQTIRDWNALPDSIITSAEGAEDGVARFTSLVRSRD